MGAICGSPCRGVPDTGECCSRRRPGEVDGDVTHRGRSISWALCADLDRVHHRNCATAHAQDAPICPPQFSLDTAIVTRLAIAQLAIRMVGLPCRRRSLSRNATRSIPRVGGAVGIGSDIRISKNCSLLRGDALLWPRLDLDASVQPAPRAPPLLAHWRDRRLVPSADPVSAFGAMDIE